MPASEEELVWLKQSEHRAGRTDRFKAVGGTPGSGSLLKLHILWDNACVGISDYQLQHNNI